MTDQIFDLIRNPLGFTCALLLQQIFSAKPHLAVSVKCVSFYRLSRQIYPHSVRIIIQAAKLLCSVSLTVPQLGATRFEDRYSTVFYFLTKRYIILFHLDSLLINGDIE